MKKQIHMLAQQAHKHPADNLGRSSIELGVHL
jgi:hypothetical protein